MQIKFKDLVAKQRSGQPNWKAPERLLVFDPGETIGWAYFEGTRPARCGQISWLDHGLGVARLFERFNPTAVLYEEYRLYEWALKQQAWSELPAVQIIGVIRFLAKQRGIPEHDQGANDGKAFVTDEKLKGWGIYQSGKKHSNDALRHGCHFLLFGGGPKRSLPNGGSTRLPGKLSPSGGFQSSGGGRKSRRSGPK